VHGKRYATGRRFQRPPLQGHPGARFIYISWGTVDQETFTRFRRAKLWLDAVPPVVVTSALRRGVLVGRLGLTDAKGNPHCASVRAPTIEWSAAPSSAESSCPVFTGH
jgi:hypothetical protein